MTTTPHMPAATSAPSGPAAPGRVDVSAQRSAVDDAVAILTLAFATDPVIRWFFPSSNAYLDAFPPLLRTLANESSAAGAIDRDDAGAALWLAPGAEMPEDELAAIVEQSVGEPRLHHAFAVLEAMSQQHPLQPHWYLPFIGVDPRAQGLGHGSSLLRSALRRSDVAGLPAYLEASSPRNRALYERHGFDVVGEIRAGDCPPLWPMWRPAAAR